MIDKQQALEALEQERQWLLRNNMPGAEHILVHHAIRVIEDMDNTGYWMDSSLPDDAFKKEQCSVCGKWSRDVGKMYCPHCGSLNGGK